MIAQSRNLSGIALLLTIVSAHTATAFEWRYCLASSTAEQKVFMTDPFMSDQGMALVAAAFERMLTSTNTLHESPQCPRADNEDSVITMRSQAIHYHQQINSRIIELTWGPF